MLNSDEVKRLFELARIHASPEEMEKLPRELDSILMYFKTLSDAPLGDAPPTLSFAPAMKELRLDREVVPKATDTDILRASFPERERNFLKTQRVFGE